MNGEISVRKFKRSDLDAMHALIIHTIDTSYAEVYGPGARQFFKDYHSLENILKDADEGVTVIMFSGSEVLGTGTLLGDDIRRVFISPDFQRHGIGKRIMQHLEDEARRAGIRKVVLSSSLPAREFYLKLGYQIVKEASEIFFGDELRYFEMEKKLT